MTAAEIAERVGHPRAGDRREVRPARQAHRRGRRARQRPRRQGRRAPARGDGRRPGGDRRRHVLRLDVEGLRGLAGGAVHRPPARLRRTPSRSSTTTSRTERPIALRVARDLLRAEPELQNVLVVAACRESYLLDYANERSRFMFNFGDGAVAGLLVGDADRNELLGSHAITDGSLLAAGEGAAAAARVDPDGYRFLDVADPASMKGGLDAGVAAELRRRRRAERSSARALDARRRRVRLPAAHEALDVPRVARASSGCGEDQAVYLDDTGHMSGVDSLLGLDRAARDGRLARRRRRAAARRPGPATRGRRPSFAGGGRDEAPATRSGRRAGSRSRRRRSTRSPRRPATTSGSTSTRSARRRGRSARRSATAT